MVTRRRRREDAPANTLNIFFRIARSLRWVQGSAISRRVKSRRGVAAPLRCASIVNRPRPLPFVLDRSDPRLIPTNRLTIAAPRYPMWSIAAINPRRNGWNGLHGVSYIEADANDIGLVTENLDRRHIEEALASCEVIEEYSERNRPLPDCLVLAWLEAVKPFHAVVAIDEPNDRILIVTVYCPTFERWNSDWRTRK
jgi:hypothetical protein